MLTFHSRIVALIGTAALIAGCGGQSLLPQGSSQASALQVVTPATTGKLTAAPGSLNFTTTPTLKLTISEKSYTGAFKLSVAPSGIVKFSPAKGKGPAVKLTVTAVSAGKATFTVKDNHGGSKSVPITVTQGVIIIQ